VSYETASSARDTSGQTLGTSELIEPGSKAALSGFGCVRAFCPYSPERVWSSFRELRPNGVLKSWTLYLGACANRRATFRTWQLLEGLCSLLTSA
jgi:hypothetical protein